MGNVAGDESGAAVHCRCRDEDVGVAERRAAPFEVCFPYSISRMVVQAPERDFQTQVALQLDETAL